LYEAGHHPAKKNRLVKKIAFLAIVTEETLKNNKNIISMKKKSNCKEIVLISSLKQD
jgi:hypothetical protein